MDTDFWMMIVASTVANLMAIMFLYSIYQLTKAEEKNEDGKLRWYAAMLLPLFIVFVSVMQMRPADPGPLRLADIRVMTISELSRLDLKSMSDAQLEEAAIRYDNLLRREMSLAR